MAVIEFENNTDEIIEEMRQKALAWLEEAGGDIRSQAATNSRRASGETAGSFQHKVDEESMVCSIGSSLENAVWEEFGTGEYALHGDGRAGAFTARMEWIFIRPTVSVEREHYLMLLIP